MTVLTCGAHFHFDILRDGSAQGSHVALIYNIFSYLLVLLALGGQAVCVLSDGGHGKGSVGCLRAKCVTMLSETLGFFVMHFLFGHGGFGVKSQRTERGLG